MTDGPALSFPTARTLAGWWRQLASYEPLALWVGHLTLHRIEAPIRSVRPMAVDAPTQSLLRVLSGSSGEGVDPERHLLLPGAELRAWFGQVQADGLIRPHGAGWALTERGQVALEHASYPRAVVERRSFYFVENRPVAPPHFLPLPAAPPAAPGVIAEGEAFDLDWLRQCFERPPEWKQRFRFPTEPLEGLTLGAGPAEAEVPAWQRVAVDRPERLTVALVRAPAIDGGELWLGFAVRSEGWGLQSAEPLFVLTEGAAEVFPELADPPSAEDWRPAWRAWAQSRNLPTGDVEACRLEQAGHRLCVHAPTGLVERLRTTRSDVFKGDTWSLAGDDRLRPAAVLDLVEG